MTNSQTIIIPLSTSISLEALLEIAQALTETIEDAINDAGGDCEINELDVAVENSED